MIQLGASDGRAAGALLAGVFAFALAVRPPETFGASMALCCALAAVLAAAGLVPGRAATAIGAAALALAALALAHDTRAQALEASATFLVAAVLGAAVATVATRRAVPWVAVGLAAAGVWVAAIALGQRAFGLEALAREIEADPSLPDRAEIAARAAANRAFALFGTPAALGGFLLLALPVTVGLAWGSRRRGAASLAWAAAAVQVGGLAAAQSAGSIAALLVALAVAVVALRARRLAPRALLAGAGLLVALLALVVVARGSKVVDPSDPTSPWRLRAGNFVAAARMSADHPWLGVGLGGFAEVYPAYRRAGDNETRHVHDLPLELVAEAGVPLGLAASALFFALFLGPLLACRRAPPFEPWRAGAAVGLAGFALHNLVDFTALMPSVLWSAALLRGAIARPGEPRRGAASGTERAFAGLALAAGVVAAACLGLSGLADDLRTAARRAAYAGEPARAEELARRATLLAPWDADAALFLARATIGSAGQAPTDERRALALARAERAVRLAPARPAARETRARARLLARDFGGAYADLVEAAARYPQNSDYAEARRTLRARLDEIAGASR